MKNWHILVLYGLLWLALAWVAPHQTLPDAPRRKLSEYEEAFFASVSGVPVESMIPVKRWRVVDGMTLALVIVDTEEIVRLADIEVPTALMAQAAEMLQKLASEGNEVRVILGNRLPDRSFTGDVYSVATTSDAALAHRLGCGLVGVGLASTQSADFEFQLALSAAQRERRGMWK